MKNTINEITNRLKKNLKNDASQKKFIKKRNQKLKQMLKKFQNVILIENKIANLFRQRKLITQYLKTQPLKTTKTIMIKYKQKFRKIMNKNND